ncbi:VWA domain-containing protein, partial [Candidatus Gracilibacteria bacterium]|nr:VWA domain-containing protein [Candidatus Gracilibacteria bacterium]
MCNFYFPYVFLLLPVILFGGYYFIRKNISGYEIDTFQDIETIYHAHSPKIYIFSFLVGVSTFLGIAFFAHPYCLEQQEDEHVMDLGILLDSSYSMLARDLHPNRFEATTQAISDFLPQSEGKGVRVGMYIYAGFPFTLSDYSFDIDTLQDIISKTQIDMIDQSERDLQGTASSDALLQGIQGMDSSVEKVLILLTDGEINRGYAIEPVIAHLKEKNIRVYTVGIGKGEPIDIEIYDEFGSVFRTQVEGLKSDTLKAIA